MSAETIHAPTGVIFDEAMSAYHSTSAFGVHDLDDLTPHPLLFFKKHVSKAIKDEKDSEAFAFGRYFHALALEGEEAAAARFVQIPEDAPQRPQARWLAAKKPKPEFIEAEAWWVKWLAETAGRELITNADEKLAWRMVEAIREKPGMVALLDPTLGRPEVTFRVDMKHFQLQCRSDWFLAKPPGGGPPMDLNLKTIDRLADFDKQFEKFGYFRGAAFYRAVMAKALGLEPSEPQMAFLVVEKNEPYQAALRIPDVQALDLGWREVERDLIRLKQCFETNSWPGEPDAPRAVSLPEWKTRVAA